MGKKYLGTISDPKDLVTKEYVDAHAGGGSAEELTQAEYDALSQAEKENGTIYFISDGTPSVLIDFFYPVGSYYETSDTTFNPNTAWGGTWVKDSAGKVTVAQDTSDTAFDVIGETGGAKTVTLEASQIPAHSHGMSHNHGTNNSDYGSYVLTQPSGDGLSRRTIKNGTGTSYTNNVYSSQAVVRGSNTGASSKSSTDNNTGGGGAHTNLQPYIVVNRWHRTA